MCNAEPSAIVLKTKSLTLILLACLGCSEPANAQAQTTTPPPSVSPGNISTADIAALRQSAEGGNASAQVLLARAYELGHGVKQDDAEAAAWYRKAADQGNAEAQNTLGIMYSTGRGVERDKKEAVNWYHKAARLGLAQAMFNLGTAYYNGEGAEIDDAAAYAWFTLASLAGNAAGADAVHRMEGELKPWQRGEAMMKLGEIFEAGEQMQQDYKEAAKWFQKGAELENKSAMIAIATYLISGRGVPQNYVAARHWCEALAKSLDPGGQYCLGYLSQRGLGVAQDPKLAMKYYRVGAGSNHTGCMMALANMLTTGEGGKVDRPEALLLLLQAARNHNNDAYRQAVTLRQQMSDGEWEKAKKQLKVYQFDPAKIEQALKQNPHQ